MEGRPASEWPLLLLSPHPQKHIWGSTAACVKSTQNYQQ